MRPTISQFSSLLGNSNPVSRSKKFNKTIVPPAINPPGKRRNAILSALSNSPTSPNSPLSRFFSKSTANVNHSVQSPRSSDEHQRPATANPSAEQKVSLKMHQQKYDAFLAERYTPTAHRLLHESANVRHENQKIAPSKIATPKLAGMNNAFTTPEKNKRTRVSQQDKTNESFTLKTAARLNDLRHALHRYDELLSLPNVSKDDLKANSMKRMNTPNLTLTSAEHYAYFTHFTRPLSLFSALANCLDAKLINDLKAKSADDKELLNTLYDLILPVIPDENTHKQAKRFIRHAVAFFDKNPELTSKNDTLPFATIFRNDADFLAIASDIAMLLANHHIALNEFNLSENQKGKLSSHNRLTSELFSSIQKSTLQQAFKLTTIKNPQKNSGEEYRQGIAELVKHILNDPIANRRMQWESSSNSSSPESSPKKVPPTAQRSAQRADNLVPAPLNIQKRTASAPNLRTRAADMRPKLGARSYSNLKSIPEGKEKTEEISRKTLEAEASVMRSQLEYYKLQTRQMYGQIHDLSEENKALKEENTLLAENLAVQHAGTDDALALIDSFLSPTSKEA